jgi:hypothetical protein
MKDYLGREALHTPLNTKTYSNSKYYGGLNADGKEHGRGIRICNDGHIEIGYYENGEWSTGNFITTISDGRFWVGEYYIKDGKKWLRGTQYNPNGTEVKYDKER